MRDSKRLVSIFRNLSEGRQQALLEYAEFLAGKEGAEIAATPPSATCPGAITTFARVAFRARIP